MKDANYRYSSSEGEIVIRGIVLTPGVWTKSLIRLFFEDDFAANPNLVEEKAIEQGVFEGESLADLGLIIKNPEPEVAPVVVEETVQEPVVNVESPAEEASVPEDQEAPATETEVETEAEAPAEKTEEAAMEKAPAEAETPAVVAEDKKDEEEK